MEFTFNTPVLWDFLGISGDGGIDARAHAFLQTSMTQKGEPRRDTN